MTDFQERLVAALDRCPNKIGSVNEVSCRMRSNRVAVWSSARALARQKVVVIFPGDGIGACQYIALKEKNTAE